MKPFVAGVALMAVIATSPAQAPGLLAAHNAELLQQLQQVHRLDDAQMEQIRRIFAGSRTLGQGNWAISRHPVTPEQCAATRERAGEPGVKPQYERVCGRPFMAPLYDPATQTPEQATACIDQFEFPDIPCTYPVVWVRASEAAALCEAEGKRLCDANEWEDACQGATEPADYRFDLVAGLPPEDAIRRARAAHNAAAAATRRWSYGPEYRSGVCATGSTKNADCNGGDWSHCGSNTYPAGSFPGCRSPLDVFDLNGNAAEHMNLPLDPSQMSSRGSTTLGYTEMKGSWFIFDAYRAHEDWCRWRAPYWHGSRVRDARSHENYHLGFRCCSTVRKPSAGPLAPR